MQCVCCGRRDNGRCENWQQKINFAYDFLRAEAGDLPLVIIQLERDPVM